MEEITVHLLRKISWDQNDPLNSSYLTFQTFSLLRFLQISGKKYLNILLEIAVLLLTILFAKGKIISH